MDGVQGLHIQHFITGFYGVCVLPTLRSQVLLGSNLFFIPSSKRCFTVSDEWRNIISLGILGGTVVVGR